MMQFLFFSVKNQGGSCQPNPVSPPSNPIHPDTFRTISTIDLMSQYWNHPNSNHDLLSPCTSSGKIYRADQIVLISSICCILYKKLSINWNCFLRPRMSTYRSPTYWGRHTNQQREACITDLYKRQDALETSLDQLCKRQQPTAGESSSMVDPQCSTESKPHESIHDSIQYLFTERDIEDFQFCLKTMISLKGSRLMLLISLDVLMQRLLLIRVILLKNISLGIKWVMPNVWLSLRSSWRGPSESSGTALTTIFSSWDALPWQVWCTGGEE